MAWTPTDTALHVDGDGELVRVRAERVLAGERPEAAPVGGVALGDRPVLVSDTVS